MQMTITPNLTQLSRELTTAGLDVAPLTSWGVPPEVQVFQVNQETGEQEDLPDEAQPVLDAHNPNKPSQTAQFEQAEDVERLALVRERAAEDPAFAALTDLTLGKQGV
jgi:hypothetical protein